MDRPSAARAARALIDNVERVIRGKRGAVEAAAFALFAGGHVLIEDVPGVGKTMLGRAIARSIDGSFKRIQATPDLLPSDITGSSVFDQDRRRFEFIPGPLFAHVVLVDEINRTTPRTQSALLEAMDENAVTAEGVRHELPDPLFVVATQNPIEHHGTYPLPEGQLDRFTIAMDMGYLDFGAERNMITSQIRSHPIEDLEPVLAPAQVRSILECVAATHVAPAVLDYALAMVRATRSHPDVQLGASPRAAISFVRCAQARALLSGRDFVVPDDFKLLAVPVLAHRVIPVAELRLDHGRATHIVGSIVDRTAAPVTGPTHGPVAPPAPSVASAR